MKDWRMAKSARTGLGIFYEYREFAGKYKRPCHPNSGCFPESLLKIGRFLRSLPIFRTGNLLKEFRLGVDKHTF